MGHLPNGLNGFYMGATKHLLSGMILQVLTYKNHPLRMGFGFIQIPEILGLKISHWTTVREEKKLSLSGLYFTKSSFLGSSFRQPPSVGPRHLGIMLNWTALPGPFQKLDTRWQQRGVFLLGGYILEPLFFRKRFFYVLGDWKTKQETSSVGRKTSLGGNLRVICMIHKCQHEKSCRYEVSQELQTIWDPFCCFKRRTVGNHHHHLLEIWSFLNWIPQLFHGGFDVFLCLQVLLFCEFNEKRVPCALRADRGWRTTCGKSREESMGQWWPGWWVMSLPFENCPISPTVLGTFWVDDFPNFPSWDKVGIIC